MKRKAILQATPPKTGKKGEVFTAQEIEGILVLNLYKEKKLWFRYCIHPTTGEYQYYDVKTALWGNVKLESLLTGERCVWWNHSYLSIEKEIKAADKESMEVVKRCLNCNESNWAAWINSLEYHYSSEKRWNTEANRVRRLKEFMARIPAIPQDFNAWLWRVATAGREYAFFDKTKKQWMLTCCGSSIEEKKLLRDDGSRAVHNDELLCPVCGAKLQVKTRTNRVHLLTHAALMQNIDEDTSVTRHFDIELKWEDGRKDTYCSESFRVVSYRNHPKKYFDLYYNQYVRDSYNSAHFDKHNPANRRTHAGYLYPGGIAETLQGTRFEKCIRIFERMAADSFKLHYNRAMAAGLGSKAMLGAMEYLYKGRFYRLLQESVETVQYDSCVYYGPLVVDGKSLEEVFQIEDRQRINRIREKNGGIMMLRWMKHAENTQESIKDAVIEFFAGQNIYPSELPKLPMSAEQMMNYLVRQQAESYPKLGYPAVLEQWKDYLDMCRSLQKDLSDSMVYRPRELKRRHDEAAAEINKQRMIEEMSRNKEYHERRAKEVAEKYPGAEEILQENKAKYEYRNEEYQIIVPERLVDIMTEGQILHHCAGATDRYFERIRNRETYICFLRRKDEPELPFYTIEVEPSGTIRQHRGYMDEEPCIEQIKPFLREWQKEIKKRLSKKDIEYGKNSAALRLKNMEELREKNNTRVLNGLMEDFMAVEGFGDLEKAAV